MNDAHPVPDPARRDLFKRGLAVGLGTISLLTPVAAGLVFILDPLNRKGDKSEKSRVTTLDSLPKDGRPVKFAILADRTDAWNRLPNAPVGAIYLRRTGDQEVQAFNVVCPHAGCFVDYRANIDSFFCPCHNSAFKLDGSIGDPKSPSPRGLDTLEVEIRANEVWVRFQNFQTGHVDKIPVS